MRIKWLKDAAGRKVGQVEEFGGESLAKAWVAEGYCEEVKVTTPTTPKDDGRKGAMSHRSMEAPRRTVVDTPKKKTPAKKVKAKTRRRW